MWAIFRLIIIFIIYITFNGVHAHEYYSDGWNAAAQWLKSSMNTNVDPCEDFYGFVCGNWNSTVKKEYTNVTTEHHLINKRLQETLENAINEINLADQSMPEFKKSLKIFHQQCSAELYKGNVKKENNSKILEDIYSNLLKYLLSSVAEDGRLPFETNDKNGFWKFVGRMQRYFNTPMLIQAKVKLTYMHCKNKPVLTLTPFLAPPGDFEDLWKIVMTYHNVSLSHEDVNDTKSKMHEFLHKIVHSLKNSYNGPYIGGTSIAYSKLKIYFPDIAWDAYMDGVLPNIFRKSWLNANTMLELYNPGYFSTLNSIINDVDYITPTNYGFMLAFDKFRAFFSKGIRQDDSIDSRPYASKPVFKDDLCLDLLVHYFSPAVLRLLCDKCNVDPVVWKNDITLIKDVVFATFRSLVSNTEWIDNKEKMFLIKMLNRIVYYGDIPTWIKDDNVLNDKTPVYRINESFVTNEIRAQLKLVDQTFKPLIMGSMEDTVPSFVLTAYNTIMGEILNYVGYQIPPLYNYYYPLAVKFGITGNLMGHEIMHSFGTLLFSGEEDGIVYYHQINNVMFKNETLKTMNKKANCLIPYYDEYCTLVGERVKEEYNKTTCEYGKLTLEENLADSDGIKAAYMAYKFTTQTFGDEPLLPGLTEYTADQIFFITYAREWCSSEVESTFDPRDTHSFGRARVEQPLMNFPAFAKVFQCSKKSRYGSRKEICSVYGSSL